VRNLQEQPSGVGPDRAGHADHAGRGGPSRSDAVSVADVAAREGRYGDGPVPDADATARLATLVRELAVVHGRVVLASGREADYYVDARRPTLHHEAAPLIGQLLRQLTADWDFEAVGGLTMGADPVALAMLHAGGRPLDAFVVRKETKDHGMQRRIEGPDVEGRRVLAVEDTSTTGGSVLQAVEALHDAGARVVGVATVIDRDTGAAEAVQAAGLPYRYLLGLDDLGLPRP
jgi:orotate phosphoribosyltransferase